MCSIAGETVGKSINKGVNWVNKRGGCHNVIKYLYIISPRIVLSEGL